jgi:chromosome partitioning protein
MTEIIAAINNKGGTGKTSTMANIGGLWAEAGARVLIVDLDPQGNMAEELGYVGTSGDDNGRELAAALLSGEAPEPLQGVRPNLDVLVGGGAVNKARKVLMGLEHEGGEWSSADRLQVCLASLASNYDFIFIDVPPSPEEVQALALVAADWLLLPLQEDKSSRKGLRGLAAIVAELEAQGYGRPEIAGAVIFNAGAKSANTTVAYQRARLAEDFGNPEAVFETFIRTSKQAALHCRREGLLVHEVEIDITENATKHKAQTIADLRANRKPTARLNASTIAGLASDYEALAMEIQQRIARGRG